MSYQPATPFDSIESALEYVTLLLEATREAQEHVTQELVEHATPQMARQKQALQLVSYKLDKLAFHFGAGKRILNDLRTLRRLLLEEKLVGSSSAR